MDHPRSAVAAAFALIVFYVALQMLVLPADGFFTGDQGGKYLQARAVVTHGPWNPWIDDPARDIDPDARFRDPFLRPVNDKLVGVFPPLLPTLSAPLLATFGLRGLFVIPALGAVVCLLAVARLAGPLLTERRAAATGIFAIVATPLLFYGAELWEHAPSVGLTTTAAALLAPQPSPRLRFARALAAGVCIGLAVAFRGEALIALPVFLAALAVAASRQEAVAVTLPAVAGFGLVAAPLAVWNRHIFGSVVPMDVRLALPGGPTGASDIVGVADFLTNRQTLAALVHTRFEVARALLLPKHSALFITILCASVIVARLVASKRAAAVYLHAGLGALLVVILVVPVWRIGVQHWRLSEAFAFASVAQTWVFIYGLLYACVLGGTEVVRHPRWKFVAAAGIGIVLFTSALMPHGGGMNWGARFLLTGAPLLALAVALIALSSFECRWHRACAGGCALLLIVSTAVQSVGLVLLDHDKRLHAAITSATEAATESGELVVTDLFWFPQVTARLHHDRRFLVISGGDDLAQVGARAHAAGVRRLVLATSTAESTVAPPVSIPAQGALFRRSAEQPLPGRALSLYFYIQE